MKVILQALVAGALLATPAFAAGDLSNDRAVVRQPDEAATSADRKQTPVAKSPYAAEQNAQVPIAPEIRNGTGANQDGESSRGVRSVHPPTSNSGH
jgi:hypothetical protein